MLMNNENRKLIKMFNFLITGSGVRVLEWML